MRPGRLEITTHIGCPINCVDCPQALLRSKYNGKKDLNLEDYKKVIDKIPTNTRIDFSGMCEPFANPDCADMILYAYNHGNPLALYTTLQGATYEDWEKLKDIKYEVVTIHLPDKDSRSTFRISDDYLRLLSLWECNNYSCHGNLDDRVRPYIKSGKGYITFMHDRAGNVEGRPHFTIDPNIPLACCNCIKDLNHNVLLPDGTTLVCCMDYGMSVNMGNLFTDSYEQILNSEPAQQLRQLMTQGDCLCRHCTNARRY